MVALVHDLIFLCMAHCSSVKLIYDKIIGLFNLTYSATTKNLWGMLLGRLFVRTAMGLGPPFALYVSEVWQ